MKNEKILNNSELPDFLTSSLLALSYPAAMLLFGSLDQKRQPIKSDCLLV